MWLFSIVTSLAWGLISTNVFGLSINDGIWWVVMILLAVVIGLLSTFEDKK